MQINHAIRLLTETCALKHISYSTQKTYSYWLKRYSAFLQQTSPLPATAESKMEAFLTRLAATNISASTQNQAFNALLFFYREVLKQELGPVDALRAKRPAGARHCPAPHEVTQLLASVADQNRYPTRLITHLLYACGLRVNEPLSLRVKDLDLSQHRLFIHQAKGNKGRVFKIPDCLIHPLRQQLRVAQSVAEMDRRLKLPVPLLHRLATKYPGAAYTERWAWLFPAHRPSVHPQTGLLIRWHCHPVNVQRCVRAAARKCQLEGITPHHLRHAFATHALQRGAFIHDLQAVLGHNQLETTMRYLHAEAERVLSPLDHFNAEATTPLPYSPLHHSRRPGHFAPKEAHQTMDSDFPSLSAEAQFWQISTPLESP